MHTVWFAKSNCPRCSGLIKTSLSSLLYRVCTCTRKGNVYTKCELLGIKLGHGLLPLQIIVPFENHTYQSPFPPGHGAPPLKFYEPSFPLLTERNPALDKSLAKWPISKADPISRWYHEAESSAKKSLINGVTKIKRLPTFLYSILP